jgi:transposase
VSSDYAYLHQELRRKGMTLMLLWQEHSERHPGAAINSYSQFCENYRRFAKTLKRSMRQVHRARTPVSSAPRAHAVEPRATDSLGPGHWALQNNFSWLANSPCNLCLTYYN